MIHKYNFGNFPCAISLAKILEEIDNKYISRWVCRQIQGFYTDMHLFWDSWHNNYRYPLETKGMCQFLLTCLLNKHLESIKTKRSIPSGQKIPSIVYNHLENVITTIYKVYCRKYLL